MSVHWGLDAHTPLWTPQRPICWSWCHSGVSRSSYYHCCPFPSSPGCDAEISVRLLSPPATAADKLSGWQQHLPLQLMFCQWSAWDTEQMNVRTEHGASRNTWLCNVTRFPRKTQTELLTLSSLQTGNTSVIKSTSVSTSKTITDKTCNLCDH